MMQRRIFVGFLFLLLLSFVACRDDVEIVPPLETAVSETVPATPIPATETEIEETMPPPTPTDIPPTPTPSEPLAALVNDEPIFLAAYEKELSRYEQAQAELSITDGDVDAPVYRTLVLDALVERVLIAQAAAARGIVLTPQMVDEKWAELRATAGDADNFDAWLEANQWTEEEFREALAAEMIAEQMVTAVTADVPFAVEQVRARYLQVDDLALAESLLDQLRNGADFAGLAEQYSLDRVTAENGGDLQFFARGSLLVPAIEEAAFGLQPGQISEVIAATDEDGNQTTYYLVQLIERDPERPLSADLRYTLLQQTFEAWLDVQWEQATIIRFVDTDA